MDKALTLLGFAKKAGQIVSGTEALHDALMKKQIHFLYIAHDCSQASLRQLLRQATTIPMTMNYSRDELARATGMRPRNAYGITNRKMALAMAQEMEQGGKSIGKNTSL